MKHHNARNVLAYPADEDKIFVTGADFCFFAFYEVILQLVDGTGRDGYQALFVSLAFHFDKAFGKVEVG